MFLATLLLVPLLRLPAFLAHLFQRLQTIPNPVPDPPAGVQAQAAVAESQEDGVVDAVGLGEVGRLCGAVCGGAHLCAVQDEELEGKDRFC